MCRFYFFSEDRMEEVLFSFDRREFFLFPGKMKVDLFYSEFAGFAATPAWSQSIPSTPSLLP